MATRLEKTRHAGIYKRGGRYVFQYRDEQRKQRWESRRTLDAALRAKRARETDVERGEHQEIARTAFADYAREWIRSYQGRGRTGFREETRREYAAMLESFAIPFFATKLRRDLGRVTPRDIANFVAWLCDPSAHEGKTLSDSRVRNILNPVRSMFATAVERGDVRTNPARDARLPHRPAIEEDEDHPRPFPLNTLDLVLAAIPDAHRLMFELLAATGLRRSELIALQGRHLALAGDAPYVMVRQRIRRRGKEGLVVGPLKSRYARRDVPISPELARRLAELATPGDAYVFATSSGTPLDPDNLFKRVLRPACESAGVPRAGFHTFRHTVASQLFAEGRNAVQVQRWLGHHSPSFTLDTYVHLLDDDLGEPLT